MSSGHPHRQPPIDRARWVVPAALALALAVTAIVGIGGRAAGADATQRSQEFQQLLGGLGTRPATTLSGGPHSLDVRLGRTPFERDGTMRAAAIWDTGGANRFD